MVFINVCAKPKRCLWASPCTLAPAAWNTGGTFSQSQVHFPMGLGALKQLGPLTRAAVLPVHGVLWPPLQKCHFQRGPVEGERLLPSKAGGRLRVRPGAATHTQHTGRSLNRVGRLRKGPEGENFGKFSALPL